MSCAGSAPASSRSASSAPTTRDEREHIDVDLAFACAEPAAALRVEDGTVFPLDRQHEALVYLEDVAGDAATVLRVGRQTLPLGRAVPPSAFEVFRTFIVEGALHFAFGYDHVLFLLSLLLGVQLVGRSRKAVFTSLAALVTAFTLGHSVTLALATLDVLRLPSRPVEATIAASIVVVALITIARPERQHSLAPLAGAFGLIHGFGFSSVLGELGLPRDQEALSLFAFNVGIELAQLAFVALTLPLLFRASRSERYESVVVRGGSAIIALVALYWFVERVFFGG